MAWDNEGGWRGVAPVDRVYEALWDGYRGEFERRVPDEVAAFGWDTVVQREWLPFLEELADDL